MDAATIVDKLDDLVLNDDILPVRVSKSCMIRGRKNKTGSCPGAIAIAEALDCPKMEGIKITVGHKTKPHLSSRVVIKVREDPNHRWIGWIVNPGGRSGFHPSQFDKGKQKSPGAMVIERWSKEPVLPMTVDKQDMLHSADARQRHRDYISSTPTNGVYRIYNE